MLPFEFIVIGLPTSHQAANRARLRAWQATVRAAALLHWPVQQPPLTSRLRITVVYFHEGAETALDNDNLLKPIQDALNGLVYGDDRQITDTVVRKTGLDGRFNNRGLSLVLARGFNQNSPFVYIRVDEAPDHGELL
jgi:crossover junction endodeoxyribonuclease RusA